MASRKLRNKTSKGKITDNNEYMTFINKCREKNYPKSTKLYIHHIVPIHDGGTFEPQNEVQLSYDDHVLAHRIRFKVYNDPADQYSYASMEGIEEEIYIAQRKAGAAAVHAILKTRRENMWDSDFQKEMARRSVAKYTGQRSAGGKIAGKLRWMDYIITSDQKYLFYYQKTRFSKREPKVCVFNCRDGTEVLDILNTIVPNLKFVRASPLITGERKYAYGWTCELLIDEDEDIE